MARPCSVPKRLAASSGNFWSIAWRGFRLAPRITERDNMAQIPTVKIKAGKDYALVNESDYDPDTMDLFDEPAPKAKAEPKAKAKKKAK